MNRTFLRIVSYVINIKVCLIIMFKKIKNLLGGRGGPKEAARPASLLKDKDGHPLDPEMQNLILLLLIYVSSADGRVAKEETDSICALAERHLGLSQGEIPQRIQTALAIRDSRRKIEEYIDPINNRFSTDQRITILSMVWSIALADNNLERSEERSATKIGTAMRLSPYDQEKSRTFVEDGLV